MCFNKLVYSTVIFAFVACELKPKVIVEDQNNSDQKSITSGKPENAVNGMDNDVHQVVADSVLQASRYTYVKASENKTSFWIAIPKQEIVVGHTYYYRGGLKKSQFPSQEFNRTFDEITLVSNIIDSKEHPGGDISNASQSNAPTNSTNAPITEIAGAIKLADLLNNQSKYEGKVVKVSGNCVKANYQIMGKNWFHLQDGHSGKDGKKFDLTITTQDQIKLGDNAAFEGKIYLKKDFGAGYKYDIIMEEAKLIK